MHFAPRHFGTVSLIALLGCAFLAAPAGGYDLVVTFGSGGTTQQRAAVNYAAALWESWLTTSASGNANTLEITVNFSALGAGTLAQAQTEWLYFFGGYALVPSQYMVATGSDLSGVDATITFNSSQSWYAGTDAATPAGQYDLVTVAVHEIGHALGMQDSYHTKPNFYEKHSWGYKNSSTGTYQLMVWDSYLRDQNGRSPSTAAQDDSFDVLGDVTFRGPATLASYGPLPVYAPSPYQDGSSLSHIDPAAGGQAVMNPAVSSGLAKHGLYDYEVAAFTDLWWDFVTPSAVQSRGGRNYYWHNGSAYLGGLPPAAATAVSLTATGSPYSILVSRGAAAASVEAAGAVTLYIESAGLAVGGALNVGNGATVQMLAGTTLSAGELNVGSAAGGSGTLRLDGGALTCQRLKVGSAGAGTLRATTASMTLRVTELLEFGPQATLEFAPGSVVNLAGGHWTIAGAASGLSTALANVTLVVESTPGQTTRVEAAGADRGPHDGWTSNLVLAGLVLGGTAAGRLELVDAVDNQPAWAGPEALYVQTLQLNPGASVLLGPALYYLNGGPPKQLFAGDANLDGRVDLLDLTVLANVYGQPAGVTWAAGDFNGDGAATLSDLTILATTYGLSTAEAPLPEPAGLVLLGVGAGLLLLRRRRRP